jgi:8-oxo-dGTP pyrophosphatase MutT (NUDIX family)
MSLERKENRFAGVLIKAKDTNRVLLTLRSDKCSEPHTWALVSGGINDDEDILTGLKREVSEELGVHPDIIQYEYKHSESAHKMEFLYYEGFTEHEFIPILNEEHDAFGWFEENELPNPIYSKLGDKIKNICKMKNKK